MWVKSTATVMVHSNLLISCSLPSRNSVERIQTRRKCIPATEKLRSVVSVMDTGEDGAESQRGPGRGPKSQWSIFLGWICETVRLLKTWGIPTKCSGKTREWTDLDQVSHEKNGSQRKWHWMYTQKDTEYLPVLQDQLKEGNSRQLIRLDEKPVCLQH